MSVLSTIIQREFLAKVKNKSFIVMTFLSPLLFVAIMGVVAFVASIKGDQKQIAILDASGIFEKEFESDKQTKFYYFKNEPLQALKDSVQSEFYDGLLYIPVEDDLNKVAEKVQYISNDSPNLDFVLDLEDIIAEKITKENYLKNGIDTKAIDSLKVNVSAKLSKSTGEDGLKGINEIKTFIGFGFGYLIMMFIIIYGNMVMRSVIEEKTNRIIEIIISSVKPFQLMMGKIIGTSFAGLLQFLVWVILGGVLYGVLGAMLGTTSTAEQMMQQPEAIEAASKFNFEIVKQYIDELNIVSLVLYFLVYFVGGYFLYCSFYAAIGAAVDNETDSQQFLLPIMLPLILGIYIGFATVINDPHGTIATVFSIVPLTSPIVMLMRIPFGVPWWQIALSIVLLYGFFIFVVWVAAKIYRVGILMYGKKPTWGELLKWMKY